MDTEKEFRAKNPHLAAFWPYQEILNNESPRGRVLVSAGFLEEILKDVLNAFMIDGKSTQMLMKGSSLFGSLWARTEACFALGLLRVKEYEDLCLIREIRNEFAHKVETTFDTPYVAERCAKLNLRIQDFYVEGLQVMTNENRFSSAAVALIMNLINRPHYVGLERRTVKDWAY